MTDADRELRLLLAERAITRTLYSYASCLDYGDEDGWLDCFTADGRWTFHAPAPYTREHIGTQQLTEFFRWHSHAPEKYHKHLVCNITPHVDLDQGTAQVESFYVRVDQIGEPVLFAFGRYRDQLRVCDDGRWRLASRDVDYEGHPGPK